MRYLYIWVACLAGIGVNCVIIGPSALESAWQGNNDFRHLYVSAKLVGSGRLYQADTSRRLHRDLFGEANPHLEVGTRMPFVYLLYKPISTLPYATANRLWMVFLVASMFVFVRVQTPERRMMACVACCWSLPVIWSVAIGQDIGFFSLLGGWRSTDWGRATKCEPG